MQSDLDKKRLEQAKLLLDGLFAIAQSIKGQKIVSEDYYYAEGLLLKFFYHSVSAVKLLEGPNIHRCSDGSEVEFYDIASLDVLCRAAYECLLTTNYIFITPQTEDEREFRYLCWRYSGLNRLSKITTDSDETRVQAQSYAESSIILKNTLEENSIFISLKPKEKARLLRDGLWRIKIINGEIKTKSWKEIGNDIGLFKKLSDEAYGHMSDYAHSESISIMQIKQSHNNIRDQRMLASISIWMLNVFMVSMGLSCSKIFSLPTE